MGRHVLSADLLLSEKEELSSLVLEKRQIGEKLASASGGQERDFGPVLELCWDLSDMVDEVSDIVGKRHQKEHAAFDTKVKFSRRLRRKAKDLEKFEIDVIREYELGHLSLEHGRRMVSVAKLLKSKDVEKARRDAKEFYGLLEASARLWSINEELSKKKARTERARRSVEERLSALVWLEEQPGPDLEKAGRHEQKAHLLEALQKIRLSRIYSLQSMPVLGLLDEAQRYRLDELGFPAISVPDAASLSSYLHKSGIGSKSARQLLELLSQRDEKLRHELPNAVAFRCEVGTRRAFLEQIAGIHTSDFLSITGKNALAYLSVHSDEAASAAALLSELEKTAREDAQEWGKQQQMVRKKAELQDVEKAGLIKSLQELEELENILEGKTGPETQAPETKKQGLFESIAEFFK